jgi:hypothetical protein
MTTQERSVLGAQPAFSAIVVHRLQATRIRLLQSCSAPADMTS